MNGYFDGITFETTGDIPDSPGYTAKYFNGYCGIQYNHAGSFYLAIDHRERMLFSGPHVFLTYPDHFFEYGPVPGELRHHVFCCFRGPRVAEFQQRGLFVPDPEHPAVRITRPEPFLASMRSLQTILHRSVGSNATPPRAVLLLEDLLLQIQEQPPLPAAEQHLFHPLDELAEAIRRNPHLDWDMEKEARSIGISPMYLRKLFTEYFTCPPHKYILECRLQRAADLLLHKNIPVAEVAADSGFDDPYYFSRIFKKRKGMSPLKFRCAFAP